jgi:hypothetical protein
MAETMTDLMVVTVCFGPGHPSMPNRRNSPITILSASLLTLVSISCATLGLWRFGTDLDIARNFIFENGFLSHWQVWIGLAVGVQYASLRLNRFARSAPGHEAEIALLPELSTVRATATM